MHVLLELFLKGNKYTDERQVSWKGIHCGFTFYTLTLSFCNLSFMQFEMIDNSVEYFGSVC